MPVPLGIVAAAGKPAEEIRILGTRFEDLHRGGWDPEARLADQRRDGVAAEVIYPTVDMAICNHRDFDYKKGMSAGRGFIALAIVIVGRRHLVGVLLAALFFGFATGLQLHFQAMGLNVPFQFFLILPYVLTILPYVLTLLVLAGRIGRASAPAGLGQPYERS